MKKIYFLRVRMKDDEPWSDPTPYRTRKARDHDGSFNRVIGGLRTHSYEERKTEEQIAQLFNQ